MDEHACGKLHSFEFTFKYCNFLWNNENSHTFNAFKHPVCVHNRAYRKMIPSAWKVFCRLSANSLIDIEPVRVAPYKRLQVTSHWIAANSNPISAEHIFELDFSWGLCSAGFQSQTYRVQFQWNLIGAIPTGKLIWPTCNGSDIYTNMCGCVNEVIHLLPSFEANTSPTIYMLANK